MEDNDLILVSWDGRGDWVTPKYGNSSGTIDFLLPRAAATDAAGKSIQVFYTVMRSGAAEPSTALDLTVEAMRAEVRPHILNVVGASGPVDKGEITRDSLLTLSGMAGASVTLDVFDNAYPVETILAESDGSWRLTLSGLTESEHIITVGNVRGQLVSDPWPFTVMNSTSGYEGFETIAPMQIPRRGGVVIPASGVRLTSLGGTYLAAVARAGSQQGEHGFHYLSLAVDSGGHSVVYVDLPAQNFKTIGFTLWAVTYARELYAIVHFLGLNYERLGYREIQLHPEGRVSEIYTAPPGKFIYQISVEVGGGNGINREVACDSIYWSE
ncbi:hypothetical protein [Pseudomonas quasicaspiana]|uniref:hypothetical protein n=1 Tax=Pseudomonas quasicaspiana TaxID=2829821 RepID=UPI001E388CE4|nr:hypothetical protein [Pseudomonas quasicaspiana]MCD5972076.1 hypothetical protein [Pseudomonas quasicaspiana]